MKCAICSNEMRLLPYKDLTLFKRFWKCDNCQYKEEEKYTEEEEVPDRRVTVPLEW